MKITCMDDTTDIPYHLDSQVCRSERLEQLNMLKQDSESWTRNKVKAAEHRQKEDGKTM